MYIFSFPIFVPLKLRVNIKIEGVLYLENAREKNDAVSS